MSKLVNKRWKCPCCGVEGWETGRERVSPRFDHDRADGRRCKATEKKNLTGRFNAR